MVLSFGRCVATICVSDIDVGPSLLLPQVLHLTAGTLVSSSNVSAIMSKISCVMVLSFSRCVATICVPDLDVDQLLPLPQVLHFHDGVVIWQVRCNYLRS